MNKETKAMTTRKQTQTVRDLIETLQWEVSGPDETYVTDGLGNPLSVRVVEAILSDGSIVHNAVFEPAND